MAISWVLLLYYSLILKSKGEFRLVGKAVSTSGLHSTNASECVPMVCGCSGLSFRAGVARVLVWGVWDGPPSDGRCFRPLISGLDSTHGICSSCSMPTCRTRGNETHFSTHETTPRSGHFVIFSSRAARRSVDDELFFFLELCEDLPIWMTLKLSDS